MKKCSRTFLLAAAVLSTLLNTAWANGGSAGGIGAAIPENLDFDFASRQLSDEATLRSYYEESKYKDNLPESTDVKFKRQAAAPQEADLRFEVKEVRVTKSELLSVEELRSLVAFDGTQVMTVKDLQEIVDKINAAYLAKGVQTAQAVLPPQVIKDGVVYIRLIEGHYGEIKVQGNKRILSGYVYDRVTAKQGELSDLNQLQKDLLLYNNTNNHRLSAELVPGKEVGTSDLVLTLHEPENPWSSYFFVDNANQDESGLYRAGFMSAAYGLSGADDRLVVNPIFTEGSVSGMLAYDAPISNKGTRATFSYSRNRVKIIDGQFEDFDIKAYSNDLAIGINHPLNVTALAKVDFFAEAHRKWSNTTYAGWDIADNETNLLKAGLNARSYDKNGLWFVQLSVSDYDSELTVREREVSGNYYGAYVMRRQNLPNDTYLLLRAYGQYTDEKDLPSSEQFSVGGIATVRGYEESELSGDKGYFASLEYGFPLSKDKQSLRGFVFYDYGAVYNSYNLQGDRSYISSTGAGLEFFHKGWYGKVALGIPLEDSGEDIHKSKTRTHFYLQKNI
ncbi:MAG: ShlB/FhaC/HecB family hemolysin secretion/activation protein [Phascolarctobacterium sp.]|nr:ShlB/FhaC/HecB family hemolysin secretion/activation protein [Phascolarctobacterium sp.]